MKKVTVISLLTIITSVIVIYFIKVNNDHSDCETIIETTYSKDDLVKTKKHSCNEKYNF